MGGFGSGRPGYRPSSNGALSLNLNKLFRDQLLQRNAELSGTLVWKDSSTGQRVSWMNFRASLGTESGSLRLVYCSTFPDGRKHHSDYSIGLTSTPQRLGGRRWWFTCPATGKRAWKLYLPAGALRFASRSAYRLSYPSQREHARDRALRRAFKERHKLGSDGGIGDYIPKPKWMRQHTYHALMDRVSEAEAIVDQHGALLIERLTALAGRAPRKS